MTNVAISVEEIGKRYKIGTGPRVGYGNFRESIMLAAAAPLRRFHGQSSSSKEFWALRDISFDIKHGEAVGIIGRNGAGKSTLLKVLSRITEPTTGRAVVQGRVGSLLEVGTGFHPELTGRENVFLNGAVMGMTKSSIAKHFDEIVDFAGVADHLDTPVKRYSSGMYMRLAFAVAAHLEPEVLVVDEVLAVGDAEFQKKCLGKMGEVAKGGRTVLFVSHNMAAVSRLCKRIILLEHGSVAADDATQTAVSQYLGSGLSSMACRRWDNIDEAPGNDTAKLRAARVITLDGATSTSCDIRRPIGLEIAWDVLREGHLLVPNLHLYNEEGACLFSVNDQLSTDWHGRERLPGQYTSTVWIPGNFLAEGLVLVNVAMSTMDPVMVHFSELDAIAFQVVDSLDGDSARGAYAGPMPGMIRPVLDWVTTYRKFQP